MTHYIFVAMRIEEAINLNKAYMDFIKPALEKEDFEICCANEELRAARLGGQ